MSASPLNELVAGLFDATRAALFLSGDDTGEWIDAPPGCEELLEGLEHPAFLKDHRLRFVAVNRRFCEALGRAKADVLGKTDFDCYPAELAEEHRAADRRVLAGGAPLEVEERGHAGGALRPARLVQVPVQDRDGRVVGVLGVYRDAPAPEPGAAEAPPAVAPSALPRRTVLLADDEPMLLTLGEAVLRRHGFDVLLARDGREALERYRTAGRPIDLVVLDRAMPHMSGREAFGELRKLDPGVAVLFVSGFAADQLSDEERTQTRGFLAKPYAPLGLVAAVREALARGT